MTTVEIHTREQIDKLKLVAELMAISIIDKDTLIIINGTAIEIK